jgi:hypothetical protein
MVVLDGKPAGNTVDTFATPGPSAYHLTHREELHHQSEMDRRRETSFPERSFGQTAFRYAVHVFS